MAVTSIGSSSVSALTASGGSGNKGSIVALERQLNQIQKKIRDVTSDDSLSAQVKQEELALYQVQAQGIEAQIQQLQQQVQQKQAQALANTQEASKTKSQSSSDSQAASANSKTDVVA
jgi:hypothetical protein